MAQSAYPLHKKSVYYRLECNYSWGGCNEIPLLLHTNVNLKKLAKDIPSFLNFVDTYLARYFDFADYMNNGDEGIFSIEGIERKKDEDIDAFLARVSDELQKDNADVFQGAFDITMSEYYPSSFNGFTKMDDKDVDGARAFCPAKYMLDVLIQDSVKSKAA